MNSEDHMRQAFIRWWSFPFVLVSFLINLSIFAEAQTESLPAHDNPQESSGTHRDRVLMRLAPASSALTGLPSSSATGLVCAVSTSATSRHNRNTEGIFIFTTNYP